MGDDGENMTDKTGPEQIIEWAREAKAFMTEADVDVVRDDLIMRAAVSYNMLISGSDDWPSLMTLRGEGDDHRFTRAQAIALIAHNFEDYPPTTPHRAVLFATVLET
jgi:hypothetical protein